ncbi:MAG: triosephosphate isomerase [Bermanella sp.]|jgi:triosephosphate isomerase
MRRTLVAGNWKMHGTRRSVEQLLTDLKQSVAVCAAEVAVIPPYPYLPQVTVLLADSTIAVGAQNVSEHRGEGAYTGEISAEMLKDMGCQFVLVGHSERRALFAESDQCIAEKLAAVLGQGMQPILCLGESLAQRAAGETLQVVRRQLQAVLQGVDQSLDDMIVAYEPVWAIGTGETASPAQAQEVHAFIRQELATFNAALSARIRILYGGSVKAANAEELFAQPDIDGGLVGGASLDASEFAAICKVVN